MNRTFNTTMVIALLVILLIFSFGPWHILRGQPYQEKMLEAGVGVAGALFVIALFVERAMGAVNALVFGEQLRSAEVRLQMAPSDTAAADEIQELMTKRERLRLLLAFIVGILVSGAGIRTLQGLLDLGTDESKIDLLLYPVDVLLTAALIAGGSNGLAFLVQALKDRIDPPENPMTPNRPRLTTTS